jgi:DnaJ-class molecular chaperone
MGKIEYGEPVQCNYCKGRKQVYYDGTHSMYNDSGYINCPHCNGSGRIVKKTITTVEYVPYEENPMMAP